MKTKFIKQGYRRFSCEKIEVLPSTNVHCASAKAKVPHTPDLTPGHVHWNEIFTGNKPFPVQIKDQQTNKQKADRRASGKGTVL